MGACILIPLDLAFGRIQNFYVLIQVAFFSDIVVSFNMAYIDRQKVVIDERWDIFLHNIKTWLVLDLLTACPFSLFNTGDNRGDVNERVLNSFELLKLLKLLKLKALFYRKNRLFFKVQKVFD